MSQTSAATPDRRMVRVEGLRKRYRPDAPEAVAGIDFAVGEGELFGLLGPNGAGKTTTIGVITTRVRPSAGGCSSTASTSVATRSLSSARSRWCPSCRTSIGR